MKNQFQLIEKKIEKINNLIKQENYFQAAALLGELQYADQAKIISVISPDLWSGVFSHLQVESAAGILEKIGP